MVVNKVKKHHFFKEIDMLLANYTWVALKYLAGCTWPANHRFSTTSLAFQSITPCPTDHTTFFCQ